MRTFWQDLRFGARMLLKKPHFSLIAVITLALGIGANTLIFSVVYAVLLRPLPFTEQERLVIAWKKDMTTNSPFVELAVAEVRDWQAQNRSFTSLALMPTTVYGYGYTLTDRGDPVQLESAKVTGRFFSILGAQAALGRVFDESDDRVSGAKVVVLSDQLWRERFNADPNIIGQTVTALAVRGFGLEPQPHQQIIERDPARRRFRQRRRSISVFEQAAQPLELAPMKLHIDIARRRFLRPGEFALDQFGYVRQFEILVQLDQIRFDGAAAHQMNAREQDAIDVKQRFNAARALLVKESPLRLGETEIVMTVMTSNTGLRNHLQLIVLRRRMQNERREELFEHIAVFLEQQSEELLHIVRDQVNLQAVAHR